MREIPLTKGKVALVDAEDYERVAAFKWKAKKSRNAWYAMRVVYVDGEPQRTVMMHRFILGITDYSIQVDHRDHDGLHNQRANLRAATNAQNQANARKFRTAKHSQYKGVCRSKSGKRWQAAISNGGKYRYLGSFINEKDAALAYDAAAREAYGEFAALNFPDALVGL